MFEIAKDLVRTVRPYKYSPLRRLVEPRRFQAYCVGTNKSGTHSIGSLLAKDYNASHEEDHGRLINGWIDLKEGKISANDFKTMLLNYERYAWLEMDSSHVHAEYIDQLVKLFPEAKFILTIRDCYSWLDSYFNQVLNYPVIDCWSRLHKWRYAQGVVTYAQAEKPIEKAGFYPLENYFNAWASHNMRVLDSVPSERLLILRTAEISTSTVKIANFLNIPVSTLDAQKKHSFKAPKQHGLLAKIDPDFVRYQAQKRCESLMTDFFSDYDYLDIVLSKSQGCPRITGSANGCLNYI